MTRKLYDAEPQVINHVVTASSISRKLEIATRNENKLEEFRRILTGYEIVGKDLKVDEIQDINPMKVIEAKAKLAWEKNDFNPIVVEDTSLEIMGLGGRPGVYVNDFCSEIEMRRMIAETWLSGKDRRAVAKVIIAIFDGSEVHIREGRVDGEISEKLKGSNGFGWDDFFIPVGSKKTFAEMTNTEKDKFSMRRMALENLKKKPFSLNYNVYMLPEPFVQEIDRVRIEELQDKKAVNFAFGIESIEKVNKPNKDFIADKYIPIRKEKNDFYSRFNTDIETPSLGLLLTDIDKSKISLYKNEDPILWQMGPKRRYLALAQRAEYFMEHQSKEVHKVITNLEKTGIGPRSNKRSSTIEHALGTNRVGDITKTIALKEIGYKKISSDKEVSRTSISETGLINKIGKEYRSIFGVGSMPPISGWRDVLVTSALGHMPVFTHRNSLNAVDPNRQVELIRSAKNKIEELNLDKIAESRALKNIGAAIGCNNISEEMKAVDRLYKNGTKLFRIYTINGDPRVVEMARSIRQKYGSDVEIFVGQVTDKAQALKLIEEDILVDGLIFGHGGGMQCTSATNGMALTTLEEIYDVITDPRFNEVTVVAEGGVGKSVGGLLIMGVDLILTNQKFVHGTIELGDLFFEHHSKKAAQPYHGSASAPTMIIESSSPALLHNRLYASGRAKKIEGKPGYMFWEEKANSMVFYINEFKHYAARTLADLGVSNMKELREFTARNHKEMFRIISYEANSMGNHHFTT